MDNTELHYLTYDPEEIWKEMMVAYVDAGGDILYPGDEKEMLLRAVQACMVQAFAGVDNALRMQTLRYAVRDYLDVLGEQRGCTRLPTSAAVAEIEMNIDTTGASGVTTIGTGSRFLADSGLYYVIGKDASGEDWYVEVSPNTIRTLNAEITCETAGTAGNELSTGETMTAVDNAYITDAVVTKSAGGGAMEDDDTYRARIRVHGLANVTTGPAEQYRAAALDVDSRILDAIAVSESAGVVDVYLLFASGTSAADKTALISAVGTALSANDTRPLTDYVEVAESSAKSYTLNVKYTVPYGSNILEAVSAAVDDYKAWQNEVIGQAFNPDRLVAAIYQAGASLVTILNTSSFDSGTAEYTEIGATEHCTGIVTVTYDEV